MRAPALTFTLVLASVLAGPARAADPVYGYDLPKAYPKAYKAVEGLLPQEARKVDWAGKFDGTSVPLKNLPDGRLAGWVCKPNDCMANKLVFVVSPDGDNPVARLTMEDLPEGNDLVLGKPSDADVMALKAANMPD